MVQSEAVAVVEEPAEPPSRYLNREVSWLEFNSRVLELAERPATPLLERVKFLAIFSSNLDEFFQVRVAGLKDQLAAGLGTSGIDDQTPSEQLRAVTERTRELTARHSQAFVQDIGPALVDAGICFLNWPKLTTEDRKHLLDVFERQIFPVLTPLAVDPGHPFPYISNLSLNLAVIVRDPDTGDRRFARVKVPPLLPRFVALPDGARFVPLEQVIAAHLKALFPGMDIAEHFPFRVTRNADLTLEEGEADDLLAAVEMELRRRRFGKAVRLEVDEHCSEHVRELLRRELELHPDDVYAVEGLLDLAGLMAVAELDRADLKDEPWAPTTQPGLATAADEETDLFAILRDRDVLVHHPYDSFATSVEAFIEQAAADPDVLAIKQTLYRTSGDSPIVEALIRAAESGKQVATLVELKARFDEQANIAWAKALEEVGVHVVYGLVGLKTHSKTALVVRQEADGIRRYCHIGTGNYNSRTARLYEDIGLLSADPDLGADLSDLFNLLTGYSRRAEYRKVLLAPVAMRERIIDYIRAEAAAPEGRIFMKLNSLTDAAVIEALYEASRAGVHIDLVIRGICCLRPGVAGLSSTIRVRSIIGRYLEHSRIFAFDSVGGPDGTLLIGSADMMPRNLDRRIEVMVPVSDPRLRQRLCEIIDANLADDVGSWELCPDGRWEKVPTTEGVSVHRRLQELAVQRARLRRDRARPAVVDSGDGSVSQLF
ncbi:MAG: RNA degradosome polyphosphate kinase, partial [Actinomycetota bacterium]|nr:RNA degradosome polyphosphate kinase [Actinomycetota bacterium]